MSTFKLVRDKIPQIIRDNGETPLVREANIEEYFPLLKEKLREEVEEFCASEQLEEIADILEVLDAISAHKSFNCVEIEQVKIKKALERGGFTQRVILEGLLDGQSEKQRPKVGVGVIVLKEGKVLLAKRKGSHSAGVWGSCGGHLEFMESLEGCATRETLEEAGIEIENLRFLCVTNFRTNEQKHYVDIGFVADWKSGEPTIKEPDRQEEWGWYELNALPEPIFSVLNNYFEAHRTGRIYFDA